MVGLLGLIVEVTDDVYAPREPTAVVRTDASATSPVEVTLIDEDLWPVAVTPDEGAITRAQVPSTNAATANESATRPKPTFVVVAPEKRCPCVVNCTFSSVENEIHSPIQGSSTSAQLSTGAFDVESQVRQMSATFVTTMLTPAQRPQ